MAKAKKIRTKYICHSCGTSHMRWQGVCDGCEERNTLEEEIISNNVHTKSNTSHPPMKMTEVKKSMETRFKTGIEQVDSVLGGGLVLGSLVLLGGEPGVGKSTLLLQMAKALCEQKLKVLYVSGEESQAQVKLRAERLGVNTEYLYLYSETQLESIFKAIEDIEPVVYFLDSIQTVGTKDLESSPGSVSQVRESTMRIMQFTKKRNLVAILVGHVTKGGDIAGPRLLEHMVDVVLHFEGDRNHYFRMLRGIKNRFGATDEVGIFEMKGKGLVAVANPAAYFISDSKLVSGSCFSMIVEGTQPFLVEVQALVTENDFSHPRRTVLGYDLNKLNLILAVMEKRLQIKFGEYDVCVSLAGGVKSKDPALDLAVIVSILSSIKDRRVPPEVVFMGEVGLGGEVRMISHADLRVREVKRQGLNRVYAPKRVLAQIEEEDKKVVRTINEIHEILEFFR
ncbi:MAG: DNA repair protein RadA [Candidatus Cloacimonadota bacterium]|nr:MAG: DNA repair protein RadA [Candidatus Cloacimonadota bacterium]